MCNINVLKKKIEETRKKMYETYENNPNDPQILTISQSLDVLLNEYGQAFKSAKKLNKGQKN
ncbi:aspartyl-phosphate phosphatase Spo0E family protein [Virgibacillus necropolis]|uniref:Spo0E family sporulation regulatory protein-aspartic acid phosphatase n=1 Tax=Virgibacillus necropolis TaxID=163877 RepID=UPI00384D26B9